MKNSSISTKTSLIDNLQKSERLMKEHLSTISDEDFLSGINHDENGIKAKDYSNFLMKEITKNED